MANILTPIIPTLFSQGLKALRRNCVMPSLVNNSYSSETAQKGQVILVPLPSAIAVQDVIPGPVAPDPAGIAPTTASIPLSYWKEAPFSLNEREVAQVVDGIVPIQLSAAVEAIADAINQSIFGLYTGVYGYVGVAGTTPFATNYTPATDARKTLNNQLAPMNNRRFVVNPDAEAQALNLQAFAYALNAGNTDVIKEGQIGRKLGFDWFMDQRVPTQVAGTITTGLVAQAATVQAAGLTTIVATTAASTGACAINLGDIITFAGDTQTYAVTAAAVQAAAATNVNISISPPKVVALAGGEAITVKASHVVNLAFQRDAFAFASRQLQGDMLSKDNIDDTMMVSDPISGLSMRLMYRTEYHRTRLAFDVLWGVGLIRPQLACRIAG